MRGMEFVARLHRIRPHIRGYSGPVWQLSPLLFIKHIPRLSGKNHDFQQVANSDDCSQACHVKNKSSLAVSDVEFSPS